MICFHTINAAAQAADQVKGLKKMDMKALVKGMTAGAAVGLACYALSSASPMKKHSIKRDANKAMRAAESLIQDITSVFS